MFAFVLEYAQAGHGCRLLEVSVEEALWASTARYLFYGWVEWGTRKQCDESLLVSHFVVALYLADLLESMRHDR